MNAEQQQLTRRWKEILDTMNEDDFRMMVEPLMDRLITVARRKIYFFQLQGITLKGEITPEELVGESLIKAWEKRKQAPRQMTLRGWLIATMFRCLKQFATREFNYRNDKAISLDEPLSSPADTGAVQEEITEWYQPDEDALLEDIIPDRQPVDYELPLTGDVHDVVANEEAFHVMMMHDEFEMSIEEVAATVSRSLEETAAMLEEARVGLRHLLKPSTDLGPRDLRREQQPGGSGDVDPSYLD